MRTIEEFKFDAISNDLKEEFVRIHKKIVQDLTHLESIVTEPDSKNQISSLNQNINEVNCFSKTIFCFTRKEIQSYSTTLNIKSWSDEKIEKDARLNIKEKTELKKIVTKIFNYSGNRRYLLQFYLELGIKVCLYCNAQDTSIYRSVKNEKFYLKGNLDHIYPKDKNPFISLSINNLIPVCGHCNQRKSNTNLHYNPFDKNHNHDFKFDDCIKFINGRVHLVSLEKMQIVCKDKSVKLREKLDLIELYKNFEENADELVSRFRNFHNGGYGRSLTKSFKVQNDFEKLKYFVVETPLTRENVHKYPLHQFKFDLFDSLQMLIEKSKKVKQYNILCQSKTLKTSKNYQYYAS